MKHHFTATPLALLLLAAGGYGAERPNILFIMVDEMRWNVMSCEGHPFVKTPNLDRLAREGTRFAATYTCSPVCTPSRYCAFTSRYAHVHGAVNNGVPPAAGQLLLPAILQHHGYATAISGKLHFLPAHASHGFDDFWSYGGEGPGKLPSWPEFLAQAHSKAERTLLDQPYPNDPLGRDIARLAYPKEDTQTFWITARAGDFLRKRDKQKPFFLFVSYLDPHSPSHLPEPYWSMFDPAKMPTPNIPETVKQERRAALKAGARGPGPARSLLDNEEMARQLTAKYFAKVCMVDDNVGKLLQDIEQLGLMGNTLIVFTADHGNMLGDRGRWFKGLMYEGSSRIPLLIKAPKASALAATFNQGRVVTDIVENIDVMPTLMEMAGLPLPPQAGFQGKSLVNLVTRKDPKWKNTAYSELGPKMIRTPQYKLIKTGADYELYDMTRDSQEQNNLVNDPGHARVIEELKAKLEAWLKSQSPLPVMEGVEQTPAAPEGRAIGKRRRQGDKL
jgi:arylsulfatase A-like enzyme